MRARHGLPATAIAVGAVVALALAAVLLLTAQGGAGRAEAHPAAPAPTRFPLPPADAHRFAPGGAGTPLVPNGDDFAVRTRVGGPLLLFLPATGEQPDDYTRLLTTASEQGYHVLGLDYYDLGRSVSATCNRDAACYGDLERNRFDGSDPFRASRVTPGNSILARLRLALGHLERTDPHGGWDAYLRGGAVQWPDVVVAGHSQGGGIAAWIAHTRRVRGVLMFGSPIVTDGDVAASWLRTPSATPAAQQYAFDSTRDVFFGRIRASWRLLGLGPEDDVTDGGAPHGHAITTSLLAPDAHIGMAADSTPTALDGEPVYLPVWTWMLRRFI